MTPNEFIAKWRGGGKERAEAQSFFNDLCALVGHKTPREADPTRTWFAFEYGAEKTHGGKGFADAWKRNFFGWEAKGTGRSLQDAYIQLKMYADDLLNPPLLVVSDLNAIEIHTNFTNTVKEVHRFTVPDLIEPAILRKVWAMFHSPEELRPGTQRSDITKDAAEKFAALAEILRGRGNPPPQVAHFLNRLVFCMFAEDIGLLPNNLFTRMVEGSLDDPDAFEANAAQLFRAMREGGQAGFTRVDWFNGGLFDNDETLRLERNDLRTLMGACQLQWDQIDPSIFGTLFERGLDPNLRVKLGAHYTDPATIEKLIRPVIIEPLLAHWETEKQVLIPLMEKADIHGSRQGESAAQKGARTKAYDQAQERFTKFLEMLRNFTVLDPACGSGNFLFMSLRALKDVEQRVMVEAEELGLPRQVPGVGPRQVRGIELNEYAAELARITVWIGELQWMIQNGYGARKNPILPSLDQIECRDALLDEHDQPATWPMVDAIVGNPPFIGGNKMGRELGTTITAKYRAAYRDEVSSGADFVCFWFEKARQALVQGHTQRAGLVATNSIRHGKNREVLQRIKDTGNLELLAAWSSLGWWDKGAAVDVSLIAFGPADNPTGWLDDRPVREITAALRPLIHHDYTQAKQLASNKGVAFQGVIPRAELKRTEREKLGLELPDATFNLNGPEARRILDLPETPRGEPMSAVVRPYVIADDFTDRSYDRYIVNFRDLTLAEASMFEAPLAAIGNVRLHRKHLRGKSDKRDREHWWQMARWREKMMGAIEPLQRYIAIPRHAKHFLCNWVNPTVVPDSAVIVIARDDDTFFGLLQSFIHQVWALRQGSELEDRPRYTHTTSFETFPFPDGLTPNVSAATMAEHPQAAAIATAARALVDARNGWLHPVKWVAWERTQAEADAGFPERAVPLPGHEKDLADRTLTALYNARPLWLGALHDDLDRAVATAYGWEWPLDEEEILRRLFELNVARRGGAVEAEEDGAMDEE